MLVFLEDNVRKPLLQGTFMDKYVALPCKDYYIGYRRLS